MYVYICKISIVSNIEINNTCMSWTFAMQFASTHKHKVFEKSDIPFSTVTHNKCFCYFECMLDYVKAHHSTHCSYTRWRIQNLDFYCKKKNTIRGTLLQQKSSPCRLLIDSTYVKNAVSNMRRNSVGHSCTFQKPFGKVKLCL